MSEQNLTVVPPAPHLDALGAAAIPGTQRPLEIINQVVDYILAKLAENGVVAGAAGGAVQLAESELDKLRAFVEEEVDKAVAAALPKMIRPFVESAVDSVIGRALRTFEQQADALLEQKIAAALKGANAIEGGSAAASPAPAAQ